METKRRTTKEIIAYLAEKFPACFSIEGAAKPLKVGIFQDLSEQLAEDEMVSKTRLRQALRHYTSSWRYLKAVKLGAFRVDVNGEQVAEIDQDQADYALKTLKESQEKVQANKAKAASKKAESSADMKADGKSTHKAKAKVDQKAKYKTVKSTKKSAPKAVELKPIESSAIAVGKAVKVQLANSPMAATITEVSGDDITVQLSSGMVVKTKVSHIFTE